LQAACRAAPRWSLPACTVDEAPALPLTAVYVNATHVAVL
jgi:hypothetical protein